MLLLSLIRALVVLLASTALLALGSPAASAPTVHPTAYSHSLSSVEFQHSLSYRLNAVRTSHVHHGPLVDNRAERWANHLAQSNTFYHQSMFAVMRYCHARAAGEVMAKNVASPRQAIALWLNSPTHRHVIVNSRYTNVGVGVIKQHNGLFLIVIDFVQH